MLWWRRKPKPAAPVSSTADLLRFKYLRFRELLGLNNECLELMAGLQEDLQFVPPRRDVLEARIRAIYEKVQGTVAALENLSGAQHAQLRQAAEAQRGEVERYIAACQELATPRLSAWLSELNASAAAEAGGKAAALAEVKNRLGLAVPDGYVLTTEAYRQFCGLPRWTAVRDAIREVDLEDLAGLEAIAARLEQAVMGSPVPRAVEIAITERARTLSPAGGCLAVRSSAVGEGGQHTFAGQFLSLINVAQDRLVEAYKRVVAGRFNERALFYRLSTGLAEVESPMAVLFLPVIRAAASGILYTRDPGDARSKTLWVTSTHGLGLDIASGRMAADLFVMSRSRPHPVLDQHIVRKEDMLEVQAGGGLLRRALDDGQAAAPSLATAQLQTLADWGLRIEEHFGSPQDIEWALDEAGQLWILQARPLAVAGRARARSKPRGEPLLSGGTTVYPGQVSGAAYLLEDLHGLNATPEGAVLFLHRASPEIVPVLPRLAGLVAERGNVTGHAATLLREFKVPAVFQMPGAFERLHSGEAVSLDAVRPHLYRGTLWPAPAKEIALRDSGGEGGDPIARRLLALSLVDPSGSNFRPAGCKSTHDVLRFCHEKAIETMFALNDVEMERGSGRVKRLQTELPVHLYVLDLGNGLAVADADAPTVQPEEILSRPFRALWKGISHPAVTWTRTMPASLSDLASVMAGSFSSQGGVMRALGEESYLLVADEYMNLNSRLAYHFSLVDACLSGVVSNNYVSFRFAGGGATRQRRNLRACFIQECLAQHGFRVDRRGDLVNAWLKKAPAEETEAKLDILGRLMACSSQLDMYMTSHEVMKWYVRQFLEGNYHFEATNEHA